MESLTLTAARAMTSILRNGDPTPGKVALAWHVAAGPALGRAGEPHWSPNGTLTVRPRDAAWGREIARARPVIGRRLDDLLGKDVVKKIVVL